MTESAIAGAAGVRPLLFRPPYSATPAQSRARERARWPRSRATAS